MQINLSILEAVVTDAKAKAAGNQRWLNAIDRAMEELITNPYVDYRDGVLLVLSPTSGTIYEVTEGICFCAAFWAGKPCKHRAQKRLIERYLAVQASPVAPIAPVAARAEALTHASAPLRKPEGKDRYVVEGWDL